MAAAQDSTLAKQMEELLRCSICKDPLKEPRTLGCFHSFCKHCLAKHVESQREIAKANGEDEHLFNCPLCRTQFRLKERETVELLPSNFFINNLLEIVSLQQQSRDLQHCESCGVPAVCRCVDCERYLCGNCLTVHGNLPSLNDHVVLTLEELAKPENQAKAKGKSRCQKHGHGNKPFEFYCITCKELACINCIVLDHPKPDHDYHLIAVVATQHKQALKKTSAILEKRSNKGQNALQMIERATQFLESNVKNVKHAIIQQEKEILDAFAKKLQKNTAALLGEVDTKHKKVNQALGQQQNNMKSYVEKVNGSLGFAQSMLEKGSSEEILSLGEELEMNAKDIEKKCPKLMKPVHAGFVEYQTRPTRNILDTIDLNDLGKIVDPVQLLCESSTILQDNIDFAQQLEHWVDVENFCWKLCYRASEHGWRASDFHGKCDYMGPTVTLVKSGRNIFGGFTDKNWENCEGHKSSTASFLFSLRNKDNLPPFKCCPLNGFDNEKAISCHSDYGAVFGGSDLFISDKANTNQTSCSKLGDTYQPPPGYQRGTRQTQFLLAGSRNFQPSEIEVYRR